MIKSIVLTNNSNKKQLIALLVDALRKLKIPNASRKLVVTGPDPIPFEITGASTRGRIDL